MDTVELLFARIVRPLFAVGLLLGLSGAVFSQTPAPTQQSQDQNQGHGQTQSDKPALSGAEGVSIPHRKLPRRRPQQKKKK